MYMIGCCLNSIQLLYILLKSGTCPTDIHKVKEWRCMNILLQYYYIVEIICAFVQVASVASQHLHDHSVEFEMKIYNRV